MERKYETIYLIYKKWDNELYAYTTIKDRAERFLEERNRKNFYFDKQKIHETVLSAFMASHPLLLLVEIPLYEGTKYIEIMGTPEEENALNDASDQLYMEIEAIGNVLQKYPFKEKYLKLISKLTNVVSKRLLDGKEEEILEINTFSLFCNLFSKTF